MDTIGVGIGFVDLVYERLSQVADEKVTIEHYSLVMAGQVVITPKG